MMFKLDLKKPDGRDLSLYSRRPLPSSITTEGTLARSGNLNSHLRWHPLREEWVAYASHRQNRTFLPPPEYNPLMAMTSANVPTELPTGDYDMAVFENLFPSFYESAEASLVEIPVPSLPARGRCEVVVFTQDARQSLGSLPIPQIKLLLDVWADRYQVLRQKSEIKYVLAFENRGVEMGVTLHHPHGQIYGYAEIPPIPAAMLRSQEIHWAKNKSGLIEDLLKKELEEKTRVIFEGPHAVAFLPAWARYPYEVWVVPRRRVSSPEEMTSEEREDYARALKTVLLKYENLWQKPFPYLMLAYPAPTDGKPHPEWHFHLQFFPPYRTRDRLKFLAGTELGAGFFINDSLPEEKAKELQNVEVKID